MAVLLGLGRERSGEVRVTGWVAWGDTQVSSVIISLGDSVHPIDYSGGAVLVRLSGGHLFPKRGFQS